MGKLSQPLVSVVFLLISKNNYKFLRGLEVQLMLKELHTSYDFVIPLRYKGTIKTKSKRKIEKNHNNLGHLTQTRSLVKRQSST